MSLKNKLSKARVQLIMHEPFFGTLAMGIKMRIVDDCPTAMTNGREIRWGRKFLDELSPEETIGIMKHEILHIALLHCSPWRRGDRDPHRWNIAGDYVINPMILDDNGTLPEGALVDPMFSGKSVEEVYNMLLDSPSSGGGDNPDPGGCGGVEDSTNSDGSKMTKAECDELEGELKRKIAEAHQVAGNVPGSLGRLIDDIVHQKADWRQVLRDLVEHTARNDYSSLPPSRRWLHKGMCLPSLRSDEIGNIAIAIDTSGSIDEERLNRFGSEVSDILTQYHCEDIEVLYCDTEIAGRQLFSSHDLPLEFKPVGGGGTSFHPIFEYLEGNEPDLLIYFTDLYVYDYPDDPGYPVIWAATDHGSTPPFGDVIYIGE